MPEDSLNLDVESFTSELKKALANVSTKTGESIQVGDVVMAIMETTDTCFWNSGRIGTVGWVNNDYYGVDWLDGWSAIVPECVVRYTGEKWQRMLHMYYKLCKYYDDREIAEREARQQDVTNNKV